MILFERLEEPSFTYGDTEYHRAFPSEFFLAYEEDQLLGFCRIDLLEGSIEEYKADTPLHADALRRCALDFFLESGSTEVPDRQSGELLSRKDLCGSCKGAVEITFAKK